MMELMKASEAGLAIIKQFEGRKLTAYKPVSMVISTMKGKP